MDLESWGYSWLRVGPNERQSFQSKGLCKELAFSLAERVPILLHQGLNHPEGDDTDPRVSFGQGDRRGIEQASFTDLHGEDFQGFPVLFILV